MKENVNLLKEYNDLKIELHMWELKGKVIRNDNKKYHTTYHDPIES